MRSFEDNLARHGQRIQLIYPALLGRRIRRSDFPFHDVRQTIPALSWKDEIRGIADRLWMLHQNRLAIHQNRGAVAVYLERSAFEQLVTAERLKGYLRAAYEPIKAGLVRT